MAARYIVEIGATITGAFRSAFGGANSSARELGATLQRLNQSARDVGQFRVVSAEATRLRNSFDQARERVRQLGAEIDRTERPTRQQAAALRIAVRESEEAERSWREQAREVRTLGESLRRAGVNMENLTQEQRRLTRESQQAARVMGRAQIGDSMTRNRAFRGNMRGAMFDAAAMGAVASGPVIAFARQETAATDLKVAMMGANGEVKKGFTEINDLATKLGDKLPGTTADFQNMMTMLIRQGQPAERILDGLGKTTAYLAVQLKMAPDEAAKFTSKLQDATATAGKDMLELGDVIQKSFYVGVDSQNMLQFFTKANPAMAMMKKNGIDFAREMAPLAAMFDQAGMAGEQSGNAWRKVIQGGFNAGKVSKALKSGKLGFSFDLTDGKGEFGGIKKMFTELGKLKNLTSQARTKFIKDVFGDDAETQQVLSLMIDKGLAGYEEMQGKIDNQASLTARVQEPLNTLSGLWESLTGTITNLAAEIGSTLAPTLKPLLKEFNTFVSETAIPFIKNNKELVGAITAIGAGAIAATGALASLGFIGSYVRQAFLGLRWAVAPLFAEGALLGSGGTVATAVSGIGAALGGITWPIALAVGALVVGAGLIMRYWHPIGAFFEGFWQGFSEGMAPVLNDLKPLGDLLVWLGGKFVDLTKWVWDFIQPIQSTNEELGKAKELGRVFGEIIAFIAQKAMAALEPIRMIARGIGSVMEAVGISSGSSPETPSKVAPAVPQAGNKSVNTKNDIVFNLNGSNATPEQNAKAIRDHLELWQREQNAKNRSMLTDTPSLAY